MSKQDNAALYPGSFDPLTLGHLDIIERGSKIFSKLIVAVGHSAVKSSVFSVDERKEFLKTACRGMENIEITSYDGLTVEFAREVGAQFILRGLRTSNDFVYESQMAVTNRNMYQDMESIFLLATPIYNHISSTIVRDIAKHGGKLTGLVPEYVISALHQRFPSSSKSSK